MQPTQEIPSNFEQKKPAVSTLTAGSKKMVPAIYGYNNTIKSEMRHPCLCQALPQSRLPRLCGYRAGLTVQLALKSS
ncbi:hypothetical protein GCM10008940_08550 [Microbulbifer agarilyticus]